MGKRRRPHRLRCWCGTIVGVALFGAAAGRNVRGSVHLDTMLTQKVQSFAWRIFIGHELVYVRRFKRRGESALEAGLNQGLQMEMSARF